VGKFGSQEFGCGKFGSRLSGRQENGKLEFAPANQV